MLLFEGEGQFEIDFVPYYFSGSTILFLTPHQSFRWIESNLTDIQILRFHGDYYCIEYHKKEVACNGLLFNNIYENPHFTIAPYLFQEIQTLLDKMQCEWNSTDENSFSNSILKSYLQLILALASKEKSKILDDKKSLTDSIALDFQKQLENHFATERTVAFYAELFHLNPKTFSKRIKEQFNKTPMALIKERVILEAKKLLHLTYLQINEIASRLNFEDEFYFSRYFKKEVGLSPANYRNSVGIAELAQKSM